jgi:hypothetical protein
MDSTPTTCGEPIRFYDPVGPYGWLSNFSPHAIIIDGSVYPTVEHYFQTQKFCEFNRRSAVAGAKSPSEAKRLAKEWQKFRRDDWSHVRDSVMEMALEAKFRQHANLRSLLISTDLRTLIEDSSDDSYWGVGPGGTGQNRLGEILMRLRHRLRNAERLL